MSPRRPRGIGPSNEKEGAGHDLRRLQEKRRDGEEGFTLIELLVVIIIIGMLAAIAIPVYLNQQNKARIAAVKSDLQAAAVQEESYFTSNNVYVAGAVGTVLTTEGNIPSQNVLVTAALTNAATATSFCLRGTNTLVTGTTWYWNSATGGLTSTAC